MLTIDYNSALHHFPDPQPECIHRLRKATGLVSLHAMLHKDFGLWEVVLRGQEEDGKPIIQELGYMGEGNGKTCSLPDKTFSQFSHTIKGWMTRVEFRKHQRQWQADQFREMQRVRDNEREAKKEIASVVKRRAGQVAYEGAKIGMGIHDGDFAEVSNGI